MSRDDASKSISSSSSSTPSKAGSGSPSPRSVPLPSHSQGSYLIYTILGLILYTTLVSTLFTAQQYRLYKLLSFMLASPVIKYYTQYRTAFSNPRVMSFWIFSNVADISTAIWMLYVVPTYFRGIWAYTLFPTCTALLFIFFEVLQYLIFDYGSPNQKYVIRIPSNPLDYTLSVILSIAYYIQAYYIDWEAPTKWYSFLVWLMLNYLFDLSFGLVHYYTHRIPKLWKRHKTHHEYKRAELNSFANFYSDFIDSWISNIGFFSVVSLATVMGGDAYYWSMDLVTHASVTHNKYVSDRSGFYYFWEYNALCHIFQRQPTCQFHHNHHTNLNGWFSAAGFLPDSFFESYAPDARKIVPAEWYDVNAQS